MHGGLFHLPGFDVSRGNGVHYSNIYQRGYRSLNTDRTLLLFDGVEENNLWSTTAPLSRQHPLTNVERVEVIYGPTSTMYGANAFLGVINAITKEPEDITGIDNRLGVRSQVSFGSWQTRYAELTVAGRHEEGMRFTPWGGILFSGPREGRADASAGGQQYGMGIDLIVGEAVVALALRQRGGALD